MFRARYVTTGKTPGMADVSATSHIERIAVMPGAEACGGFMSRVMRELRRRVGASNTN